MQSILPFQIGLKLIGLKMTLSQNFRREIYNPEFKYSLNVKIQITTRAGEPNLFIIFNEGKMRSGKGKIESPDVTIVYRNQDMMARAISRSAEDSLDMILTGDMYYTGNLSVLAKFSYLTSVFPHPPSKRRVSPNFPASLNITEEENAIKKKKYVILDRKIDKVEYLLDPFLGRYTLNDFPHLMQIRNRWFHDHPTVCPERGKNLTDFFLKEGFETDSSGKPWHAGLRQGLALKYLLTVKKPIIFDDDYIPGTTTSQRFGVHLFPDIGSIALWPELQSCEGRYLNPYHISQETIDTLNYNVFPYWVHRNVRETARRLYNNPVCQQLEEFFVLFFSWKTQAVSHTIPDFAKALEKGLNGIIRDIDAKSKTTADPNILAFHKGMKAALEGVIIYAQHLKEEVTRKLDEILQKEKITTDKAELAALQEQADNLSDIADSLMRVPAEPSKTFRDAISAVWIIWLSLHQESMNAGLSIGRLDQVLYPYYLVDMQAAKTAAEREELIKKAIDLIGSFYFKCQDHLPVVPNLGNKLFGGSSSDQTITLGGVTPENENAVNDLTYIFLKVTELAGLRDPNVNARYNLEKNSLEYLQRLCEVNINTTSTPSLHNDTRMIDALIGQGFAPEDARNWAATGCVEPTSIGKHFGHTNCMMFNLVAPFEIQMNNGHHPLIHPKVGLETGPFNQVQFPTFESLLAGYKKQAAYMIAQSIEYNNNLGRVHQKIHPTPLLSSIFDGPLEKGKDVIDGGAIYNSSGVALVALVDVLDSLMTLKNLVYECKKVSLEEFKAACDRDFKQPQDKILLELIKKVPKFGSNDPEVNHFAQSMVDFYEQEFAKTKNYREGKYYIGFWSMSNHVAFGMLSGTMPSGRLRGKAFTPGLTPAPGSSDQLLANIKSVASLNSMKFPNNVAFNVKLVPSGNDTHEETLSHFVGYTKSYFDLGGLQMQFNVVTTEMLRDAMVHPDNYRWLMVRISGYNAYFTTLNRDMQIELIERMEFKA